MSSYSGDSKAMHSIYTGKSIAAAVAAAAMIVYRKVYILVEELPFEIVRFLRKCV